MLEGSLGAGLVMRLEGETLAKQLDEAYDIISANLVIPRGKINNPASLNRLRLKIIGIDTSQVLTNETQKVSPDTDGVILDIARQEEPTGMAADSPLPPGINEDLKSEPLIQSDDPEIRELAKEIVSDEKNRWQAAVRINDWVYRNIEKRYSPDFSNALQTLNTRKGDCGEHTALAVALLRAAGIPARPLAGLVYWPPGNGFGYHAWTEVYVGRWVDMDPTWGEKLADPSHIALAHGDILEQVRVLYKIMGNIKIDILDAK
jgi:transglutaminase-like putative cysteine protease